MVPGSRGYRVGGIARLHGVSGLRWAPCLAHTARHKIHALGNENMTRVLEISGA